MRKTRASIGFGEELWQKITAESERLGITKAGFINMMASEYFSNNAEFKESFEDFKRCYGKGGN